MIIDDKYLGLLNLLIYDKRCKMSGIISDLQISSYITGYGISLRAFMNYQNANHLLFISDFENGNAVFLIPFGVKYMEKEMDELAEEHTKRIKDFFGDKFREDMIMRISEDERQEEIRKFDERVLGLKNWERYLEDKEKNQEK